MSQSAVLKWRKLFKNGRDSVENEPRTGRPSTSQTDDKVQRVREVLNSDGRLSARMIADRIGIDTMTVHTIITENLAMRKICAELVPKVLTDDQKKTASQRFLNPLTVPTWPQQTFFYSQKWHPPSKDTTMGPGVPSKKLARVLSESAYQADFESWKNRWQRCVDAQGMYFEEF